MSIVKKILANPSLFFRQYLSRDRFPWLISILLFVLAYGGSLFYLNAIYWDDWTLFNVSSQDILDTFNEAGSMFNWSAYMHISLLSIGPWAYRILTLLLMFFSGYLLWLILKNVPGISIEERNIITLLFLLLPLNAARVALINFGYTLCYFCFFLAWYLAIAKRGYLTKTASLILFLFSFNTNSTLVFYALPFTHLVYQKTQFNFTVKKILLFIARYVLFIVAPFIYFFVKSYYFPPTRLYEGYNSVGLSGIIRGLLLGSPLFIVLIVVLLFKRFRKNFSIQRDLILLFIGLVITWLAVFPYVVVGVLPTFYEWNSRHQLLMPLGISIVILSAASWICYGKIMRAGLLAIFIATFANLLISSEYYLDWLKQQQIIDLISHSEAIKKARTIIFKDNTRQWNARKRKYRFYEYNGWLKKAYGDETRFAINLDDIESVTENLDSKYKQFFISRYNAANYTGGKPEIIVKINSKCRFGRLKLLMGKKCLELNIDKINDNK